MAHAVHLPQGPPKLVMEVRFSPRELEFIRLRYGIEKSLKEIAAAMNVSLRTAKSYSEVIGRKLGQFGGSQIRITKILIRHGFISTD
jgi:predicted DNA-binding protein (UPF0251 family)